MDSPGRHHCQRVAEAAERVVGEPPDCGLGWSGPDGALLDSIRRTGRVAGIDSRAVRPDSATGAALVVGRELLENAEPAQDAAVTGAG